MLRTQEKSCSEAARQRPRRRSSQFASTKSPQSPWCRPVSSPVATRSDAKSRPVSDLRLLSPKTREATQRPSRQNSPRRWAVHASKKSTQPEMANKSGLAALAPLAPLANMAALADMTTWQAKLSEKARQPDGMSP